MLSEPEIREQLLQSLVQENESLRAKSGCYVTNQNYLQLAQRTLSVPLRHMDFQISIAGSVAQVALEQ